MNVGRQWMIKPFNKVTPVRRALFLIPLLGIISACNPTEITGKGVNASLLSNTDGSLDNKALIYDENWIDRAGPNYSPSEVNIGLFLDRNAKLITTNNNLTSNCSVLFSTNAPIMNCIRSFSKDNTASTQLLPRRNDRTYIFPSGSTEFYQVNTLYHVDKGVKTFFNKLNWSYNFVRSMPEFIPKSIPAYLNRSDLFWFNTTKSSENRFYKSSFLSVYSDCDLEGNASFSPVGPKLCFGGFSKLPQFKMVQDPTVIYHELGHALVSVMLNIRNGSTLTDHHEFRSDMGRLAFDEGLAINEGLADYFSYVVSKREIFGEWGIGRTLKQARPLSESSSMHISGISETSEGRLSYPQFVLYDPNNPNKPSEVVHYAGQIVSHYLHALTKTLKTECSLLSAPDGGHDESTNYVMLLLMETMSELGDLKARGIDLPFSGNPQTLAFFTNLNSTNSYLWTMTVNPINYRRFFQVFAKNINKYVPWFPGCSSFNQNKSEKLLDDYGLLLFRTYNDDGDSTTSRSTTYTDANIWIPFRSVPNPVSENNRRKSVLISKKLIDLAQKTGPASTRVSYYLFDSNDSVKSILSALFFKGFPVPLTKGTAGIEYNNDNIRISPGEIVGIIPNLVNNSNSTMAGVQVLATDWDHVSVDPITGFYKPCVIDTSTTVDQGGETGETCTSTVTDYKRSLGQKDINDKFITDVVAPVCMVQLDEGNSSRWVSQNEFRKKQGLSLVEKDCLGYSANVTTEQDFTYNPNECLIRFLPGANSSSFSKIDPQKTYYESVIKNLDRPNFNAGNVMLMEVNKWIPPGTKFRCRLRARFSNCSDCYGDEDNGNDDYLDFEYNGSKPFKVINFDFEIND